MIELNIPERLIFKGSPPREYLFPSIRLPTTHENTGSLIDVSLIASFSVGRPIKTGSLKTFLASSIIPCCFTAHPTRIAHSGSIPSRPILLSS